MELFHLTNRHLIPQILKEGLLPELGERSSQCEPEKAIFLFTSLEALEDAVTNWFGDEVEEEMALGIVKVTVPGFWEKNVFIDPEVGYEAICKVPIPPEFIQKYYTELEI